ncbi:MAG: hypothetical protein HGA23_05440, partial [Bacteroidales bacterium]|nr:hypothetical protein [Bacteroidales bacterium]
TDGGNQWNTNTDILPTLGVSAIAVDPINPSTIYIGTGDRDAGDAPGIGVMKSIDNGATWQLSNTGMGNSTVGDLLIDTTNTQILYAAATSGLYKSIDGGASWTLKANGAFKDLAFKPGNNEVLYGTQSGAFYRSTDAGENWILITNGLTGGARGVIAVTNANPEIVYFLVSKGDNGFQGLYRSLDAGITFTEMSDSPNIMGWDCSGSDGGGQAWYDLALVADQFNPDIIYANCKGQFSVYNRKLGVEHLYYIGAEDLYGNHPDDITYRFQRVTPMEVSPHDSNTVYYGSQYLHKTTNGGQNWEIISPDLTANRKEYSMRSGGPIDEDISGEEYYAVLYAIKESPIRKGVIWTGSNDGLFYVTKDGGLHWDNVTPDMPEGGRISNIEASYHNPGKAYYAVSRSYLGDDYPYLYKTTDFGKSWCKITDGNNGIPSDYTTRVVREDPVREGLLFAGTDFGIFISFDDGRNWKTFQRNLPITPVTDIRLIRNDLALSTMGRSFWIMDDISPLQEFDPGAPPSLRLFKPGDITGDKQNVYFTLPDSLVEATVTIEFYRDGNIIFSKLVNISNLVRDEWGIYKFVWDQHYYIADGNNEFRGPMVAPGQYLVRLGYAGGYLEQGYAYKINPELEAFGTCLEDLLEQEELSLRVAKLCVDINQTISAIRNEMEKTKNKKTAAMLAEKLKQLETGPKRYDKPMLKDNAAYLFEMISQLKRTGDKIIQILLSVFVGLDLVPVLRCILIIFPNPCSNRNLRALESQPCKKIQQVSGNVLHPFGRFSPILSVLGAAKRE